MAIWGDSSGQVCASDEVSLIQLSLLGPTNSRRGTLWWLETGHLLRVPGIPECHPAWCQPAQL